MNPRPDAGRPASVARRLLTLLLVPLGGLLLLALLFDYLVVVGPMRTTFDRSLADAAVVFAAYVREGPGGRVTLELPRSVAAQLAETQGSRPRYALYAADAQFLTGDRRLPAPPPQSARPGDGFSFTTAVLGSGERLRIIWYRFQAESRDFVLASGSRPAGEPIHRMQLTLTVDTQLNVVGSEARSLDHPYPGHCQAIEPAYRRLVGLNLLRGFRRAVRERLGGIAGCTHLTELGDVLPTAVVQAFAGEENQVTGQLLAARLGATWPFSARFSGHRHPRWFCFPLE